MAAFFRHGFSKTPGILKPKNVSPRCYATKAEKRKGLDRRPTPKLDPVSVSIAAKGFLRSQKSYLPPKTLEADLQELFNQTLGKTELNLKISNLDQRFKLFAACANKFNHSIPNSQLHQIETLEDVVKFYATPVDTRTPLDRMRSMELPENLHIQFEYQRFHPDTDTKFGGVTAFPESSTLVTGLKYKDKYKGHTQKIESPEI
ncbi:unnamed protein product [Ceutorhynchus assimilis]|uniref:Large ribosomal subunit protein mL50 n=1 Tax=Ceutorhynchus assimilis TaxID=467358 RepID=A0A9N9N2R3_9CUCU|nr:unnamed protein product [Ceutorhynchus assimilis]